jgi:hypothetical protein
MTTKTNTFSVRLRVGHCFGLTVRAKSAEQAIAKAQKLWRAGSVESFTFYPQQTDTWSAEAE